MWHEKLPIGHSASSDGYKMLSQVCTDEILPTIIRRIFVQNEHEDARVSRKLLTDMFDNGVKEKYSNP